MSGFAQHHSGLWRALGGAGVWLGVVMLAVLNPLACLLHCDAREQAHNTTSARPALLCNFSFGAEQHEPAAETVLPLSQHAHLDASDESLGALAPLPRAVHEATPLAPAILVLALLFVAALAAGGVRRLPRIAYTPAPPPPRAAA